MKHISKTCQAIWWAVEDLILVAIVMILSFRFVVPIPFGNYSYGWRECVRFLKTFASLWVLFEISRHHKPDSQ